MLVKELIEKLDAASETDYVDFYCNGKEELFCLSPFKNENLNSMKKYLDKKVDKFSFQTMCVEKYPEDKMSPPMVNVLWIEVE